MTFGTSLENAYFHAVFQSIPQKSKTLESGPSAKIEIAKNFAVSRIHPDSYTTGLLTSPIFPQSQWYGEALLLGGTFWRT